MAYSRERRSHREKYAHAERDRDDNDWAPQSGPKDPLTPDRLRVKFKFITWKVFSGITPAALILRGNSIYDPEVAISLESAMGFDEWAQLYTQYVVIGSKVKITGMSGGAVPLLWTVIPTVLPTMGTSTVRTLAQQPHAVHGYTANTGGGHDVVTLTKYISTAEVYGVTPEETRIEPTFTGAMTPTTGSDPGSQWYYRVVVNAVDETTSVPSTTCGIEMTFYVELFNRVVIQDQT